MQVKLLEHLERLELLERFSGDTNVCRTGYEAILSNQFENGGLTMADNQQNYATPSSVRSVTSYPARRGFKQGPVDPSLDHVIGVEDSIDIHCHAHEGQQDALGVAKLA
jgi:hypothetical protein